MDGATLAARRAGIVAADAVIAAHRLRVRVHENFVRVPIELRVGDARDDDGVGTGPSLVALRGVEVGHFLVVGVSLLVAVPQTLQGKDGVILRLNA